MAETDSRLVDPAAASPMHPATTGHDVDVALRLPRSASSIARTVARGKGSKRVVALGIVILMTVLAIITSGLKASDDQAYGSLHTLMQIVMVTSYVFYLMTLKQKPLPRSATVRPGPDGDSYMIHPHWPEQVIRLPEGSNAAEQTRLLQRFSPVERKHVAAIEARGSVVDLPFLRLLATFPSIVALDIQNSRVDPAVWDEFVHFESLKLILAHSTVSPTQLSELELTAPEIRISIEPSRLISNEVEWDLPDEQPQTSPNET